MWKAYLQMIFRSSEQKNVFLQCNGKFESRAIENKIK